MNAPLWYQLVLAELNVPLWWKLLLAAPALFLAWGVIAFISRAMWPPDE